MIYGDNLIVMYVLWDDLKSKFAVINAPHHYEETTEMYEVFIVDNIIVYAVQIFKGNIPLYCDITQEENDSNKTDFETNYKSTANRPLSSYAVYATQKNDQQLKPYGKGHKHIDASGCISSITLSDKNDLTYSFSGASPVPYDYLVQGHNTLASRITSVDGSTLTVEINEVENGTASLIHPVQIDVKLVDDAGAQTDFLWGAYITAADYGEDDFFRSIIVDKDGVGVDLGWYTQEEFDALGEYVVKEYDECWARQASQKILIQGPDGKPGQLPIGLYLRLNYYPTDATKTDVKIWIDYQITVQDA